VIQITQSRTRAGRAVGPGALPVLICKPDPHFWPPLAGFVAVH